MQSLITSVNLPNNWNSLSLHIRSSDSLATFQSQISSFCFCLSRLVTHMPAPQIQLPLLALYKYFFDILTFVVLLEQVIRPSVMLRYCDRMGWNTQRITAQLISLGSSLSVNTNITDQGQDDCVKIRQSDSRQCRSKQSANALALRHFQKVVNVHTQRYVHSFSQLTLGRRLTGQSLMLIGTSVNHLEGTRVNVSHYGKTPRPTSPSCCSQCSIPQEHSRQHSSVQITPHGCRPAAGWGDRLPTICQGITVRRQHNCTIGKLSV